MPADDQKALDRLSRDFKQSRYRINSFDDALAQSTFLLEDLANGIVDGKRAEAMIKVINASARLLALRANPALSDPGTGEPAEDTPRGRAGTTNEAIDLGIASAGPFAKIVPIRKHEG